MREVAYRQSRHRRLRAGGRRPRRQRGLREGWARCLGLGGERIQTFELGPGVAEQVQRVGVARDDVLAGVAGRPSEKHSLRLVHYHARIRSRPAKARAPASPPRRALGSLTYPESWYARTERAARLRTHPPSASVITILFENISRKLRISQNSILGLSF